jgi:hypothetical protein
MCSIKLLKLLFCVLSATSETELTSTFDKLRPTPGSKRFT